VSSDRFQQYLAALRPFAGLWQSVEFVCIAVGDISGRDRSGELISLATSVVFKPEPLTAIKVRRKLDPSGLSTRFVAIWVEYPLLVALNEMQPLKTLVANGHFTLDLGDDLYTVRLFGAAASPAVGQSDYWTEVLDLPRAESKKRFGIDRHCIALLDTYDSSHIADLILPRELLNEITAKLSSPPFLIDGLNDLVSQLMPGVHLSMDTNPPTRVIAPLPFNLAFYPETELRLQAPQLAFEHEVEVSVFFQPSGPPIAYRVGAQHTTEIDQTGGREWRQSITWPWSSETGKAVLLYQQKQIDELRFSRSAAQGLLGAAGTGANDLAPSRRGVQEPMSKRTDWEEVRPLGAGGQSEVTLVRRPKRVQERTESIRDISQSNPWAPIVAPEDRDRPRTLATAVWKYARPETPPELAAMKVFKLREAGAQGEEQAAARLRSEIAILQQKRSGLPELLDSNEAEGWIVTEFFAEGTLEDHIARYRGKTASALRAFRSLVETLAPLHKEGIVHRDIKPANVFVRGVDQLVLGDFGIVYVPNQSERVTRTNERVGPRDSMPQWADLGERLENIRPNFDVYMLGELLWCMVAGRLKLPREYHRKQMFDLAEMFPKSPDMHIINSILDRCVVEDPNNCLESAEQLLSILDENLIILDRGGQLLSEGVPRPCRVCGKGHYKAVSLPRNVVGEPKVTLNMAGMPINISLFACDSCGHVQLFR